MFLNHLKTGAIRCERSDRH